MKPQSWSRSLCCCQHFDWQHSAATFAYRLACPPVCLRSKVQYVQTALLLVPYHPDLLAALPRTLSKFTQLVTNCCKMPEQKQRTPLCSRGSSGRAGVSHPWSWESHGCYRSVEWFEKKKKKPAWWHVSKTVVHCNIASPLVLNKWISLAVESSIHHPGKCSNNPDFEPNYFLWDVNIVSKLLLINTRPKMASIWTLCWFI